MQIRSVSELGELEVQYKSATEMPTQLNNNVYIETSYKTAAGNYDSMKVNLCAILNVLYTSINALCSEVQTLRNKVNYDINMLSAGDPEHGIRGYVEIIEQLSTLNSRAHVALSAGDPEQGISGYTNLITTLSNNIGDDFLLKNPPTDENGKYIKALTVNGPIIFSSVDPLTGCITRAMQADSALWN